MRWPTTGPIPYDAGTPEDSSKPLGVGPDMLIGTPDTAHDFIGLKINGANTEVYRNSVSSVLSTINRNCYFLKAYPILVDSAAVLCAGRGTGAAEASGGQPELVWLSVDAGTTWQEKGQSMFSDYSVLGITGGFGDGNDD